MHTTIRTINLSLIVCASLLSLSACNWVDSTGAQSEPIAPISADGNSRLRNTLPLVLHEELALTTTMIGQGAALRNWTWSPEQTDIRSRCEGIDGFDSQLAATSLEQACVNAQECMITFIEDSSNDPTQFTVRLPQLRAPVALAYNLSSVTEEGVMLIREQPICGISINEAPLANDDNYIALRGERRLVDALDLDSLSANDTDDLDIRNQVLQIDPIPVRVPRYASEFALGTDGSFIYLADEDAPVTQEGYIEDSFVYSISDGLHAVTATAVVRVVDGNRSPRRRQRVPDLDVTIANNADQGAQQQFDLSSYFFDPDADPLQFSIRDDLLPKSGNISISSAGLLIARPEFDDLGRWRLTVQVSDGLASSSDVFNLDVQTPEQDNSPPTANDIRNRFVQNTFSYDVSVFFNDPDNDPLSFSATGLPDGVRISESGIIRGTANDENSGVAIIRVTANDNRGGSVTDGFALVVD